MWFLGIGRADRRKGSNNFGASEKFFRLSGVCRTPVIEKPPIIKQKLTEARPLNSLQKLLRNDLIRIDIGAVERGHGALMNSETLHNPLSVVSGRMSVD